jgi:glycine cleavage system H lipoate-binding protein
MIYEIFMPALSSTMTEGKITSWVKSPGDKVEKGETVVIVESDISVSSLPLKANLHLLDQRSPMLQKPRKKSTKLRKKQLMGK